MKQKNSLSKKSNNQVQKQQTKSINKNQTKNKRSMKAQINTKQREQSIIQLHHFFTKAYEIISTEMHNSIQELVQNLQQKKIAYPKYIKKIRASHDQKGGLSSKVFGQKNDLIVNLHRSKSTTKQDVAKNNKLKQALLRKQQLMEKLRKIDSQLHTARKQDFVQNFLGNSFAEINNQFKSNNSSLKKRDDVTYSVKNHQKAVDMLHKVNAQRVQRQYKKIEHIKKKQAQQIKRVKAIEQFRMLEMLEKQRKRQQRNQLMLKRSKLNNNKKAQNIEYESNDQKQFKPKVRQKINFHGQQTTTLQLQIYDQTVNNNISQYTQNNFKQNGKVEEVKQIVDENTKNQEIKQEIINLNYAKQTLQPQQHPQKLIQQNNNQIHSKTQQIQKQSNIQLQTHNVQKNQQTQNQFLNIDSNIKIGIIEPTKNSSEIFESLQNLA